MDENYNTIQAGLGWITKVDKGDFNGREAILNEKANPGKKLVGFVMEDRMIARHGQEVYSGDTKIGVVTSGSMSPVLNRNIGLAYIDKGYNKTGSPIEIMLRDRKLKATIVKTPFLGN